MPLSSIFIRPCGPDHAKNYFALTPGNATLDPTVVCLRKVGKGEALSGDATISLANAAGVRSSRHCADGDVVVIAPLGQLLSG
jgi:hypothetical protein